MPLVPDVAAFGAALESLDALAAAAATRRAALHARWRNINRAIVMWAGCIWVISILLTLLSLYFSSSRPSPWLRSVSLALAVVSAPAAAWAATRVSNWTHVRQVASVGEELSDATSWAAHWCDAVHVRRCCCVSARR